MDSKAASMFREVEEPFPLGLIAMNGATELGKRIDYYLMTWYYEAFPERLNEEGRKQTLLGVSAQALERYTAVSAQVACEMALGARRVLAVDYAVSTTGYAGPDGADVGLVYVAYAGPDGVRAREHRFAGDRGEIRRQAVAAALALLAENI